MVIISSPRLTSRSFRYLKEGGKNKRYRKRTGIEMKIIMACGEATEKHGRSIVITYTKIYTCVCVVREQLIGHYQQ